MSNSDINTLAAGLGDSERAAFMRGLWEVYSHVAELSAMGDTSLREETAEELFKSVCFTVETELRGSGTTPAEAIAAGLETVFDSGRERLRRCFGQARRLLAEAQGGASASLSRSCKTTLKGIGGFFRRYDVMFFAHLIPCDIDYQLCIPVSESMQGVVFIYNYLSHLAAEDALLSRLNPGSLRPLIALKLGSGADSVLSYYEPAAENAVGAALTGGDIRRLAVRAERLSELKTRFDYMTPDEAEALLREASERVCAELGMAEPGARAYLSKTAAALSPRIAASADLEAVFAPLIKI